MKDIIYEWYLRMFKTVEITEYHIFTKDGYFVLFNKEDEEDFYEKSLQDRQLFYYRNPNL